MQFIDLLLVRWIFGRQIGRKNYEDFEHPTYWDKKGGKLYQLSSFSVYASAVN